MDVKKRTKSIKEKLQQFGHEVKSTHCREILAIANGLRNSHFLPKNKKSIENNNPDSLHLITGLTPNTTNEYYHDVIKGIKVKLDSETLLNLFSYKDFIGNKDIAIEISLTESISIFEGFNSDGFYEVEDTYEMEDIIKSSFISDKDLFYKDNIYLTDATNLETKIVCCHAGFSFRVYMKNKHEEVLFSSTTLTWDKLKL